MNLQQLAALTEKLLVANVELAQIEALVGSLEADKSDPKHLNIASPDPNVDFASLTLASLAPPQPSYLFIKFKQAVDIDSRELAALYGEPTTGVRVKPTQPIPSRFKVERYAVPGELIVGYVPRDDAKRQVLSVRILRTPRD